MTIELSVILATYNRAQLVEEALRALAAQKVPDSLTWEVVVVDNNSRDTTAKVVTALAKTTARPLVRYVFEPRQGLSYARNRGIHEARGSILAFTDDDVLAAPDWIAQVAAAIGRWSAHGVGGRILPHWEMAPPRWLTENQHLLVHLTVMEFGESRVLSFPLTQQPQVWGANMAFRRELFDKVGEFDGRLGVTGKKLFRGEDIELINRALQRGQRIVYDPALTVHHRIGPERMRKAYFRKMEFEAAQGEARVAPVRGGRSLGGAPLWLYRVALRDFGRWVRLLLLGRPGAFDQQLRWLSSVGSLWGYWQTGSRRQGRAEGEGSAGSDRN